jgi:uncharacterized membrane protein YdjX (TVP38/TMEM64 family)
VVRFVPGFPTDIISMLPGTTDMKYSQFLFGSIPGLIPVMIPMVLIGSSITGPCSKEFLISFAIVAILSLSATVVYGRWIKKRKLQDIKE